MTIEAPSRESAPLPLLTAEQEIVLGHRVQEYRPYMGLYDQARENLRVSLQALGQNRCSDDQEVMASLYAGAKTKADLNAVQTIVLGLSAVSTFIENNQNLVHHFAKRYKGYAVPYEDLVQEGNVGLLIAVYKFDPDRGIRFSTPASYWIIQGIHRALENHSRMIRLPVHVNEYLGRLGRIGSALQNVLEREPTFAELAKLFRNRDHRAVPAEKIAKLLAADKNVGSLDIEIDPNDPGQTLADIVEDQSSPSPEEEALGIDLRDRLQEQLNSLPPREREVLTLRFGLDDGRERTLEEVGAEIGVTRERIRQIEEVALRKLRHSDMAKGYRNYI